MVYVGVDIGKTRHAVAAVDDAGSVVLPPEYFAQDAEGFAALLRRLQTLGDPSSVVVALEATGPYWKVLHHFLQQHGYRADVINPLITAHEAAADVRGRKTDKLDAVAIAQVARRGGYSSVPATDPAGAALKSLARHHRHLVNRRTEAKLRLANCLDVLFPEAHRFFDDLYSVTALAVFERFPSARQIADAHPRTLTALVARASRGKLGSAFAQQLRQAARRSVAYSLRNEGEEFVCVQLIAEIRSLNELIAQTEERLNANPPPPAAQMLQTIKGAGPTLPRLVAAELGNLERFRGPRMASRILAFAGAEPRVRESGRWRGQTKMSKRGSGALRHALYLMAGTVRLHNPSFNAIYQRQIARGKHHKVALSHVVRKLVEVLCGMYKSGTRFVPPSPATTPCS